jgi:RNA polymerase sigma factor (sigma-70 family)
MGGSGAAERLLRVLLEDGTVGGFTDAQLIERFVAREDGTAEPAFAVLVERHGPLVTGVCRAVLRDQHAAEDAFQATFLVLVKKASSLRLHSSLGPWLHAVAYRVACDARSTAARRAKHERRVAEMAAQAEGTTRRPVEDLESSLHEEIEKLAERHRRPIVLCDLEGLTHEQAARLLGTPVGTIKSRLARGRELLRHRLSRRGVALSVGTMTAALAVNACKAGVLNAEVEQMARTAMLVGERGLLTAGVVPASVAILAQGVLKSMFHSRLKAAVVTALSAAGIAIGVGFAAVGPLAQDKPTTRIASGGAKGKQVARTGAMLGHAGLVRSVAFLPNSQDLISAGAPSDDGKHPGEIRLWDLRARVTRRTLKLDGDPFAMAVAPDGQALAVAVACGEALDRTLIVRMLALPSGETTREWMLPNGVDVWSLAFAPDGKTLAAGLRGLREGRFCGEVRLWDPATGKQRETLTGHPDPVMALAFTRDGRTLASGSGTYGAPVGEVRLWDVASGRLLRTMTEADLAIVTVAFSPDGESVASGGTIWREGTVFGGAVSIWEVATGKKRITLPAFPSYVHAVSYAPAGALLATAGIGRNGDAQVGLWDTKTWKALETLTPGKGIQRVTAVKCLVFSADGKTLAAGGAAGMLTLLPVNSE